MKSKRIISSALAIGLIYFLSVTTPGAAGAADTLRREIDDLAAAIERAAVKIHALEERNKNLSGENSDLKALLEKVEANSKAIAELKKSAIEIKAPEGIKVIKLTKKPEKPDENINKKSTVETTPPLKKEIKKAKKKAAVLKPAKPVKKAVKAAPALKKVTLKKALSKQKPAVAVKKETVPFLSPAVKSDAKVLAIKKSAPAPKAAPATVKSVRTEKTDYTKYKTLSIEDIYKKGIELYNNERNTEAREAFRILLKRAPGHGLADNSLYWVAETYYAQTSYQEAIDVFRDVVKNFPDGNKSPDSMLKVGFSYIEMERPAEARAAFNDLVRSYPTTVAADKGREKLKTLK